MGELINYNSYGETKEDLYYSPESLYRSIQPFSDPLEFFHSSGELIKLREGFDYDAISFHIIQFMRVHKRRKHSNISTASLNHLYSKIREIQNNRRSSPKEDLLPREVAKSLVRHLNQERTLSQQVGTLIRRLLGMLDDSSISVRLKICESYQGKSHSMGERPKHDQ